MEEFNKCFNQNSYDGICSIIFWPSNNDFGEEIKQQYAFTYLNGTPLGKYKCWFCVKRSAVPEHGKVILKVDSIMAGRIIGYGGRNIKKIAKELGGRYVNIQKV